MRREEMPIMGILGQISHLSEYYAKQMFEPYDLKPGQAGILVVLSLNGEMSQRELAERLNLTPPSITAAIQKMEKMDYIKRTPDPNDQRVLRLSLTEKSHAYLEHIREVSRQIEARIFKGMNIEEKLLLRRLLTQVRDNLVEGRSPEIWKHPIKL